MNGIKATDRVLTLAQRGVDLEEDFKLNFSSYCSKPYDDNTINECSTSFCFAGRLAHQDGYPEEYVNEYSFLEEGTSFAYYDYSCNLIDKNATHAELDLDTIWSFFFHEDWPNCFDSLKARCQFVLDNGYVPFREDWEGLGFKFKEEDEYE